MSNCKYKKYKRAKAKICEKPKAGEKTIQRKKGEKSIKE
jgi:hypothetical protein